MLTEKEISDLIHALQDERGTLDDAVKFYGRLVEQAVLTKLELEE